MGMLFEVFVKIGVELALEHLIKKRPMSLLMGIISTIRVFFR